MYVQQAVEGLSFTRASLEAFAGKSRTTLGVANTKGRNMAQDKERVSFTIDAELFDQFVAYAETNNLSMSEAYREALQEYAYIRMPSAEAEAEFEVILAKVEAKRTSEGSIASLPACLATSLPN
jgi:hypothetical protein